MLFDKPCEIGKDITGIATVVDEEARGSEPTLKVVERYRYVLGEVLVEYPNLAARGGFWYAVAVVVKQDAFVFGGSSQRAADFLRILHRGVEVLFISCADTQGFVLLLKVFPSLFESFSGRVGRGINPALEFSAGVRFDDVYAVQTNYN